MFRTTEKILLLKKKSEIPIVTVRDYKKSKLLCTVYNAYGNMLANNKIIINTATKSIFPMK